MSLCSILAMLPESLRLTPVAKARIGMRCTMEALAKGCHKLWVTRLKNNRTVGPSPKIQEPEATEDDILSDIGIKCIW